MQNQFIFPNQENDMNLNMATILVYKQDIIKLIDEIIEIDLEIFQNQFKQQQQMFNPFFNQPMMNQNMMMPNMPNMQFMQNQFLNNSQQILEKKCNYRKKNLKN